MTSIIVLDTSYLVEYFKVHGFSQHPKEVEERFESAINNYSRFYVPLPCIFEVGDHIADVGRSKTIKGKVKKGDMRADLGKKFLEIVESCVTEYNPWIITPATGIEVLPELCEVFSAEYVIQKIGLTDTFIIQEAKRLKKEEPHYKVHIWTKDNKLKAYEPDNEPHPFVVPGYINKRNYLINK